jgi:probable rRNA maturation factor
MIEVNNFTRFKIDGNHLAKAAAKVLAGEKADRTGLSVSIVSDSDIKKLNKKYRKADKPTDVLSFTYDNSGEVIICPQVIWENAKKYSASFKSEILRVLVHGVLHILGYDHEAGEIRAQKMRKKEEEYLKI